MPIKILIADDDEIILQTIVNQIPWEECGYELAGTAKDGKTAYDMAVLYRPEIIMTDIRMPGMTGLELAEKLSKVLINTRIVFLTGHDEFKYAKQAVKLRAADYILKGESMEGIRKVLEELSREIEKGNQTARLTAAGKEQLKNKMMKILLAEGKTEEGVSGEDILALDFLKYEYQVVTCRGKWKAKGDGPSANIGQNQRLKDRVDQYAEHEFLTVQSMVYGEEIVLFVGFPINTVEQERQKSLERMLFYLETKSEAEIYFGVGGICRKEEDFPNSFDDATLALESADSQKKIVFYQELSCYRPISQIHEYIYRHYQDKELSLSVLSERLHLNATYISTIFKRYTNENFKTYLIRLRMKKACELLRDTELCIYEISEAVGYPNSQYFSVMFKKIQGITPAEYREKYTEGFGKCAEKLENRKNGQD